MRFFSNPHKPMILALARPDPKKNITTLLKAFGECAPLRELANLVFPPSQTRRKKPSLSLSLSSIISLSLKTNEGSSLMGSNLFFS
jgi:sucrose-phosphate synthase